MENYKNLNPRHKRILFYVLIGVFMFVIGIIGMGYSGNDLLIEKEQLVITGLYGERISISDIQGIELTDKRPALGYRTNGFSIGYRKKGFFKSRDGERVKAIINSNLKPWILITKKSGEKIYFSSNKQSNESIYRELIESLPSIGFNSSR